LAAFPVASAPDPLLSASRRSVPRRSPRQTASATTTSASSVPGDLADGQAWSRRRGRARARRVSAHLKPRNSGPAAAEIREEPIADQPLVVLDRQSQVVVGGRSRGLGARLGTRVPADPEGRANHVARQQRYLDRREAAKMTHQSAENLPQDVEVVLPAPVSTHDASPVTGEEMADTVTVDSNRFEMRRAPSW